MESILIIVAVCLISIYLSYSWMDYIRKSRLEKTQSNTFYNPKLQDGTEPTIDNLNEDLIGKVMNNELESRETDS